VLLQRKTWPAATFFMSLPEPLEKVIFIGDVHGHILRLNQKAKKNPKTTHIQVGDIGFGFFKAIKLEPNIHFYRGNHDAPKEAKAHPRCLGDYGLIKGTHNNIYFIAGGDSIDKDSRIEGRSWWRDEELDYETLQKVIDDVIAKRPEIIATHECPASIIQHVGLASAHFSHPVSRTAQALEAIFQQHKPRFWIFGHHHISWKKKIDGTQFICLAELELLPMEL
jgi:predicted phosphodiesterase